MFSILGRVLDSGTCFGVLESVLDSGTSFWILGSVLDSGTCFWILGSVLSLRATVETSFLTRLQKKNAICRSSRQIETYSLGLLEGL